MSDFDRRWRGLVRAATRAGEAPLPPAPDGARLRRLAAAARKPVLPPWGQPLPSAIALSVLWAVALPAAGAAWRSARDVMARFAISAPMPASLPSPRLPSTLSAPALVSPHLPPLPELWPQLPWADPPAEAPRKETPS